MAETSIDTTPGVVTPEQFPPAAAARLASKLLFRHTSGEVAAAIEVLVELLDVLGGDCDEEETDAEDSFALSTKVLQRTSGPGCPLADPGEAGDRL